MSTKQTLRILNYDESGDYHMCRTEEGDIIRIDLYRDGTLFDEDFETDREYVAACKALALKDVQIDYKHTFLYMAANANIIEN